MKVYFALIVLIAVGGLRLSAQQIYMPRNVAQAYAKGTRSADGRPGPNYWQNKASYHIAISVAPPDRTVTGSEEITYTNNSLRTLENMVFRLEVNSHQAEAPREDPISTNYLTSGVHIDEYTENGKAKKWSEQKGRTWQSIHLDKPLAPHESVNLTFKWHYDVSVESGREGAIDKSKFFIAYFYPRVAVCDDTNGWDTIPFTEGHEFYNDFNDYTFEVTAPKNFVVWATGDLRNPEDVLQPQILDRFKRSFTSDDIIHVATLKELTDGSVTKQNASNTWKWKADNVSDVAINVSDHFIWDAGSVVVDKASARRASVQAAYDEPSHDFEKMVEYGKHTLDWTSNNYPGTPYPFQKTTIVRGFADMEYPMMVNDSSQSDPNFTRFVVEHEILHSWFPFYMGINEQRYGFMDEGWTTAFEYMIGTADMGKERADNFFKLFRVQRWIKTPAADADLAIITPGDAMAGIGYRNNEYGKAALGYLATKDLLGDELFSKALHGFISDWHGKHPLPWDMFAEFSRYSGRDLTWWFSNWFGSNGYIDLAVAGVKPAGSGYDLTIKNVGGFDAPVDVVVTYTDGKTERLHQTPAIWMNNAKEATVHINASQPIKSVVLDGGIWMDANEADNQWAAS